MAASPVGADLNAKIVQVLDLAHRERLRNAGVTWPG
jgi:hypothetical protein